MSLHLASLTCGADPRAQTGEVAHLGQDSVHHRVPMCSHPNGAVATFGAPGTNITWTLCLIVLDGPGHRLSAVLVTQIRGCIRPLGEGPVESLLRLLVPGSQGPCSWAPELLGAASVRWL